MVFLGLTLYSRIMNTNPLSFLVQNNWIPCRPCRFHVPSALSLVQGFEINLYIFYILKWLGTQSKYLKIFFCQATSPNPNSPLWSFLWGLNLCFLLGDRSQDANFDKFLDCHIESYQSAGGPKLNKEAWGSFFGMKRGFKTTSKTWNQHVVQILKRLKFLSETGKSLNRESFHKNMIMETILKHTLLAMVGPHGSERNGRLQVWVQHLARLCSLRLSKHSIS